MSDDDKKTLAVDDEPPLTVDGVIEYADFEPRSDAAWERVRRAAQEWETTLAELFAKPKKNT